MNARLWLVTLTQNHWREVKKKTKTEEKLSLHWKTSSLFYCHSFHYYFCWDNLRFRRPAILIVHKLFAMNFTWWTCICIVVATAAAAAAAETFTSSTRPEWIIYIMNVWVNPIIIIKHLRFDLEYKIHGKQMALPWIKLENVIPCRRDRGRKRFPFDYFNSQFSFWCW